MLHPGIAAAFAVFLSATAPAKPAAVAKPAPANRDAVVKRLKASGQPPTHAEAVALGPGLDTVLIDIARDRTQDLPLRARAISALGAAPTPAAHKFLVLLVEEKSRATTDADLQLLRRAAFTLGLVGGPDAFETLERLLGSGDADIRFDAVMALGLLRLAAVADLFRERIPHENVERVRAAMARQLRVIESALPPTTPPAQK